MRLTYHGNHVFVLPLGPGKFQAWKKGETHPVPDEVWAKAKEKKDVKVLCDNKTLCPVGEKAVEKKAEVSKAPAEVVSLPRPADAKEEGADSFTAKFRKLNYRTAIKRLDDIDDPILLRKLLSVEKRASVKKALEAKLGPKE